MPKLEWTPVFNWDKFNFLGKRLFDFLNVKLNATTRLYKGNGSNQNIFVDIAPRIIIIICHLDATSPVIWTDTMGSLSKDFNGNNLSDAIIGLSTKKDFFIIGPNALVNSLGVDYSFIAIGE